MSTHLATRLNTLSDHIDTLKTILTHFHLDTSQSYIKMLPNCLESPANCTSHLDTTPLDCVDTFPRTVLIHPPDHARPRTVLIHLPGLC